MTARHTLLGWLHGAKAARLAGLFTTLGIADLLAKGTERHDALAEACAVAPERMIRLLDGFAAIGLCVEGEPSSFTLTEAGSLLRKGSELHDLVRLLTDPVTDRSWAHLEAGVRSGRGGFHAAFGVSIFEYMDDRPELRALYDDVMGRYTANLADEVAEHHDFGRYTTVTDVGGGDGTLLAAILRHHPTVRGTVFDRVDGDFLRSVPAGSDLYVLKWIVHDWDDEHATTILRNCRAAMGAHGRLLLVERILPDRGTNSEATPRDPQLTDLHMLMIYGGKERTREEFGTLCAGAGFVITRIVPLPSGNSLIEARSRPAP